MEIQFSTTVIGTTCLAALDDLCYTSSSTCHAGRSGPEDDLAYRGTSMNASKSWCLDF